MVNYEPAKKVNSALSNDLAFVHPALGGLAGGERKNAWGLGDLETWGLIISLPPYLGARSLDE